VFLQGFSAPVRLDLETSAEAQGRIVQVEPDAVTRWESIQRLAFDTLLQRGPDPAAARSVLIDSLGLLLRDSTQDPAFIAECHTLPDVWTLADQCVDIDLDVLVRQREDLLDELAECHADAYEAAYRRLRAAHSGAQFDGPAFAARRLTSVCLHRLTRLDPHAALATAHFDSAQCMTDRLAALTCLVHFNAPSADAALAEFRSEWSSDPLVTDKWLSIVVTRPQPETLDTVHALLADTELWQPANPNRVRAVLSSFARTNVVACHRNDGAGYALLFAQIKTIDALNPQVSSRLLTALESWRRLDTARRDMIQRGMQALLDSRPSADLQDLLTRLLG
jgi:aminopeptidase N